MNVHDPKFTARLDSALSLLTRQPQLSLRYLTRRYDLEEGALQAWLAEFNEGQKDLTPARLAAVKAQVSVVTTHSARNVDPAPAPARIAPPEKPRVIPPPASEKPVEAPPERVCAAGPTSDIGRWLEGQRVKITGRVNCFQVEVTPELAQSWLAFNTGNRKPSRTKILRFAAAMKAGRWSLNGETVKFSITGRLIDGQSRLRAIIEAKLPVVIEVRAGLPDIAQQSMDAGELRKGSHTLEMLGEGNPLELAAALKLCWRWDNGSLDQMNTRRTVMENFELPAALEKHAGLKASVGWAKQRAEQIRLMMTVTEMAFFHYVLGRVEVEHRDAFCEAVVEGLGLTRHSPVFHLRAALMSARTDLRHTFAHSRERRALLIKAWNATRAGERCDGLKYKPEDPFPEIDGLVNGGAS